VNAQAQALNPQVRIVDRRAAYREKLRRSGFARQPEHIARTAAGERIQAAIAQRAADAADRALARAISRLDFTAVLARRP
jgi:hypothetical protein